MKIVEVHPDSPLFGYVRPGHSVLAIDGRPVSDDLDFRFRTTGERVCVTFADSRGREFLFEWEDADCGDMGLTFEDGTVKVCANDCIFCFVRQQPKGLRPSLYVKDEDFRLSFTHGNFITLSNTSDADIERIIEQRLSPMYISVHTTDDTLRRCMFRNEKLRPILPQLARLAEGRIAVHAQAVLCPGVNDGAQLEQTLEDLAGLHPSIESVAVVPVGLTRYRQQLPHLRTYTRAESQELLAYIGIIQRESLERLGTRFVWAADEFYVSGDMPVPPLREYESLPQFENGVGMIREFLTNFNRRRGRLKRLATDKRVLFLTGHSAHGMLVKEVLPYIRDQIGIDVRIEAVTNYFWGDTVTVSGLLTGQDLLRALSRYRADSDVVVLPPNVLNGDDLFLDNMSLGQFRTAAGTEVVVGSYNLAETLRSLAA